MARQPKPWYRKDRIAWFVTIPNAPANSIYTWPGEN